MVEIHRGELEAVGHPELAAKVQWVAADRDGLGYDVLGFAPDGSELFIEVKATTLDEHTPFHVSAAEVLASEGFGDAYRLYRVCSWGHPEVNYYVLSGPLSASCHLTVSACTAIPET